jgi:hypothetical protein
MHIFQGHIDHVRWFLGQSGVRSRDLDDLFGRMRDLDDLLGRMVNDLFGFRVHRLFRMGRDLLLRQLLFVSTGARRG